MKTWLSVLLMAFVLRAGGIAEGRALRPCSYSELLEKAEFAVIASPTSSGDTKEKIMLPGFTGQPVVGVDTKFAVSAVLKGEKSINEITLHHYRADGVLAPNGPLFVSFDPAKNRSYLLFLIREADGRYVPVLGQADPGVCGISTLEKVMDP